MKDKAREYGCQVEKRRALQTLPPRPSGSNRQQDRPSDRSHAVTDEAARGAFDLAKRAAGVTLAVTQKADNQAACRGRLSRMGRPRRSAILHHTTGHDRFTQQVYLQRPKLPHAKARISETESPQQTYPGK